MSYIEILLGLLLLFVGGDALVRGAVAVARRLAVSPLLIGLTLVGFGTSTPELVTSLQAAFIGSPGIAVGNVVGSNIANILLILGLAAVICPLTTSRDAFVRDGAVMVAAAVACLVMVMIGALSRPAGIVLTALLIAYVGYTYRRERMVRDASAALHTAEATAAGRLPPRTWLAVLFVIGGLALTVLGARYLVSGAVELGRLAGLSETVLGLTIVAVGTSLPELVTSLVAAARRQTDVALGNIIGSNIYNVLGILGITAVVRPIPVPPEIAQSDIWVMLAATLAMIALVATGWRLSRGEGAIFLTGYTAYVAYLATTAAAF